DSAYHRRSLTQTGHFFMTKPRASLRSDNCPSSIGMSVRFELDQVSDFVGMRRVGWHREQPQRRALKRRRSWKEVLTAVEGLCGEKWEALRDRHGHWAGSWHCIWAAGRAGCVWPSWDPLWAERITRQ